MRADGMGVNVKCIILPSNAYYLTISYSFEDENPYK